MGKTRIGIIGCGGMARSHAARFDEVLDRIEVTNPDLNAVVALHDREKLLGEARDADARIASGHDEIIM